MKQSEYDRIMEQWSKEDLGTLYTKRKAIPPLSGIEMITLAVGIALLSFALVASM